MPCWGVFCSSSNRSVFTAAAISGSRLKLSSCKWSVKKCCSPFRATEPDPPWRYRPLVTPSRFSWPVTVQDRCGWPPPGQAPVDLLSGDVAVGHHEPCVGVGTVGIGGFLGACFQPLSSHNCSLSGVLLPSKVQQNVVHGLPHCGIVRQRFIAEACGGLILKFLPNGVQVESGHL